MPDIHIRNHTFEKYKIERFYNKSSDLGMMISQIYTL
jgi:hypothetical protein